MTAELKDAAQAERMLGVVKLGPARLALPLAVLREVLPCPPQFSALPASAPGLLGAVSLRGRVIPVLDLRPVLGLPAEPPAGQSRQVVVMLHHAGKVLGLLADGVCGLAPRPPAGVEAMSAQGAGLLFSGSFLHAEDGGVVSLLDAAALMRLPGLPLLCEHGAQAAGDNSAGVAAAAAAPRQALMLVRCGGTGLALAVKDIHTTLPQVALHVSSMDGRVCRGVIDHAGVRLPVVDPLALLGLGRLPTDEPWQVLLLHCASGLVGLLVSRVIEIVRVPATDLLALPPLAVARPEMFSATLRVAGHGEHLVLAAGALQAEPQLQALAALNVRLPAAAAGAGAGAAARAAGRSHTHGSGQAVLTYDIGAEVATRLMMVSAVLPLPADHARLGSSHPAVLGMFTHRQTAVTLVCLATLLGRPAAAATAHARVLLVGVDHMHFGFVVPRLCEIENTAWEQAPPAPHAAAGASGAALPLPRQRSLLGAHAVVELGQGARRRTLHLVDLQALARALLQPAPAQPRPASAAAAPGAGVAAAGVAGAGAKAVVALAPG